MYLKNIYKNKNLILIMENLNLKSHCLKCKSLFPRSINNYLDES